MKPIRAVVPLIAAAALLEVARAAPPVSAFMAYPEVKTLTISPDGRHLALTRRKPGHELLTILRYPNIETVTSAHFGDFVDIHYLHWVGDRRIIVEPARRPADFRAPRMPMGDIVRMNAANGLADLLFGFPEAEKQTGTILSTRSRTEVRATLIDAQPADPENVLVLVGNIDGETFAGTPNTVSRLNIRNGHVTRLAPAPLLDSTFVTDSEHQLLFMSGHDAAGNFQTRRFVPKSRSWQLITSSKWTDGRIRPLEETATPGEYIALDSMHSETDAVIAWNPDTATRTVLFESATSDVVPAARDEDGHVYVFEYEDHVPEYWYPNPDHALARAHAALRREFKEARVAITSATRDRRLAVARVSSPRMPTTYYVVELDTGRRLLSMPAYPELAPDDLSPTDPIELKVRDGLTIRGYLTTPRNRGDRRVPLIVRVHDGPHDAHDSYDFDPESQLLASRGYAVLQVNYRGSNGRGRAFVNAGLGRWGREMQDDITDAVKWTISTGVTDAARVCVYGTGYGAYAALNGAAREPALFRCAVGISGFYDLPAMYERAERTRNVRELAYLQRAIGTDADEWGRRSPANNAAKIAGRVMLIHGDADVRAPLEQATGMRFALQRVGNLPVWVDAYGTRQAERDAVRFELGARNTERIDPIDLELGVNGTRVGEFREAHRLGVYEQMLTFFALHLATTVEQVGVPAIAQTPVSPPAPGRGALRTNR